MLRLDEWPDEAVYRFHERVGLKLDRCEPEPTPADVIRAEREAEQEIVESGLLSALVDLDLGE